MKKSIQILEWVLKAHSVRNTWPWCILNQESTGSPIAKQNQV